MTAVSPEPGERLSHQAERMIGKYSPITAAKWWPEMSREMPRAGVNIGKRSLESQPKTGSISGSSVLQSANWPNMRGVLTIETGLPAGSKLRFSRWRKETNGAPWLSLGGEVATRGERKRGRR
jgi:hypothetical protein